jgi:hypothetical protein
VSPLADGKEIIVERYLKRAGAARV